MLVDEGLGRRLVGRLFRIHQRRVDLVEGGVFAGAVVAAVAGPVLGLGTGAASRQ